MTRSSAAPSALGAVLVGLQFALLAGLAMEAAARFDSARLPPDALASAVAAIALGLWALSANRPGNFHIRPAPREGGHLVQHGPYRWIRHPMYSAVIKVLSGSALQYSPLGRPGGLMLAGVAAARLSGEGFSWLILLALAGVLAVKAAVEERALVAHYADYADYRRRTRRFVPGLY